MKSMDVAFICKALGDSNRLEIVRMLSDGEKCGCKLLERFEISNDGVNTNPTNHWHQKLEETITPSNSPVLEFSHLRLIQSICQRDGKGIHGKANT